MLKQRAKILLPLFVLVGLCLGGCGSSNNTNSTPTPVNPTVTIPSGYQGGKQYFPVGAFHVQGNLLVDSTGHTFLLHGSQIAGAFNVQHQSSVEVQASQHLDSTTFNVMSQQWNMNVVRIPTCDYMWQADPTGYLSRLDSVVQQANAAKLVVVLDLHEDNRCGAPTQNLDFKLPLPLATSYWKALAAHYLNNPDIIFDVYNEPSTRKHQASLTDVDWQLWQNGGTVEGTQVVGMQDLVNAIRSTGAKQVVAVEGLGGGDSFENIGNHFINDPDVVYEVHIYFAKGEVTSSDWDTKFGFLTPQHAVYVGEWAFLPNAYYPIQCRSGPHDQADAKVTEFMNYMDEHSISWTAWAFMINKLILNYTNYAPTTLDQPWTCGDQKSNAGMGTLVKQHLLAYGR